MKKNDRIELVITGMTAEGNGVGKYEGVAVFVSGAILGETIIAHIIKVYKTYAIAKLVEVVIPSDDRKVSDCPVSVSCGGCAYRHVNYSAECKFKEQRVQDAINRIGGIDLAVDPIIPAVSVTKYRNKAQYPVAKLTDGKTVFGFYANRSHRVVANSKCLLQPDCFEKILLAVGEWADENNVSVYDETSGKGILRHIYIRHGESTGELMVVVVINAETLPKSEKLVEKLISQNPNIKSIQYNINTKNTNVIMGKSCRTIFGKDYIEDIICDVRVRISPLSFYQVNRNMAEILYKKAALFAEPENKTIIDLYCGIGTIGLSMARSAKKIIGVEIVPEAVEDAKINAKENKIENAEFILGDAKDAAKQLANKKQKADVIILDPPRKGCDQKLIDTVANEFSPERVVYVSCDPATFARDAKIFSEYGYSLKKAVPVDLFPSTVHVETVGLFIKN